MVNATSRPLYPVLIVQKAGWAPGTVWKGAENLAPTGFRFPNRPAPRESLYRLGYLGRHYVTAKYVYSKAVEIYTVDDDSIGVETLYLVCKRDKVYKGTCAVQ